MKNLFKPERMAGAASVLTLAASTLGVVACGGEGPAEQKGPDPVEKELPHNPKRIPLNEKLDVKAQARQIGTVLNAGNIIIRAHVLFGREIPIDPTVSEQLASENAALIGQPIVLGENKYGYTTNEENGISVGVVTYQDKPRPIRSMERDCDDKPTLTPASADLSKETELSAVYSEGPTGGKPGDEGFGDIWRYYVISTNQEPGPHYNCHTDSAGQVTYYGR